MCGFHAPMSFVIKASLRIVTWWDNEGPIRQSITNTRPWRSTDSGGGPSALQIPAGGGLTVLLSAQALFYPTDINHGEGGVDCEALTGDHGISTNLFGETKAERQPPPHTNPRACASGARSTCAPPSQWSGGGGSLTNKNERQDGFIDLAYFIHKAIQGALHDKKV